MSPKFLFLCHAVSVRFSSENGRIDLNETFFRCSRRFLIRFLQQMADVPKMILCASDQQTTGPISIKLSPLLFIAVRYMFRENRGRSIPDFN